MKSITGLRPTNDLHIGNYFGSIAHLSKEHENYMFVADLHGNGNMKKEDIYIMAQLLYEHSGYIYIQSDFPQIPYLASLLTRFCLVSRLNLMTQYKSYCGEDASAFLLTYPILMAADILMADVNSVVVGADQAQHIELTREIAKSFNNNYNVEYFSMPKCTEVSSITLYNLSNSEIKMSKSRGDENGTIFLTDTPDSVFTKVKAAVTDSGFMPENIESCKTNRRAIYNLCHIYSLVTNKSFKEIENQFAGQGFSGFKKELTEVLINFLTNLQNNLPSLELVKARIETDTQHLHVKFDKRLQEIRSIMVI